MFRGDQTLRRQLRCCCCLKCVPGAEINVGGRQKLENNWLWGNTFLMAFVVEGSGRTEDTSNVSSDSVVSDAVSSKESVESTRIAAPFVGGQGYSGKPVDMEPIT
jgi:hypothetical protein